MKRRIDYYYVVERLIATVWDSNELLQSKFNKIGSILSDILNGSDHALYYYDSSISQFFKCYNRGLDDQICKELIINGKKNWRAIITKTEYIPLDMICLNKEYTYIPVYYNSSLVAVILLKIKSLIGKKEKSNIEFIKVIDVLGYVVHGIYRNKELEKRICIDNLTGLYDESVMKNALIKSIEEKKGVFTVCKILNISQINDKYGFNVGNDVISLVASLIKKKTKHYGNSYRMHGTLIGSILSENTVDVYNKLIGLSDECSRLRVVSQSDNVLSDINITVKFAVIVLDTLRDDELEINHIYKCAISSIESIINTSSNVFIYKQYPIVEYNNENMVATLLNMITKKQGGTE